MPLFDDEEKWMSARELARGLSDALDEVQFDGRTIKISRHGRLAATLIPPPTAGDAPPRPPVAPEEPDVELTELEGLVVDAVARHPHDGGIPSFRSRSPAATSSRCFGLSRCSNSRVC